MLCEETKEGVEAVYLSKQERRILSQVTSEGTDPPASPPDPVAAIVAAILSDQFAD